MCKERNFWHRHPSNVGKWWQKNQETYSGCPTGVQTLSWGLNNCKHACPHTCRWCSICVDLHGWFLKNKDKQRMYDNLILFTKIMDGRYCIVFVFTNSKQKVKFWVWKTGSHKLNIFVHKISCMQNRFRWTSVHIKQQTYTSLKINNMIRQ